MSLIEGIQLVVDSDSPLSAVREFRLEGDPRFVTAYELTFESIVVSLRAEAELDTLGMSPGSPPDDPRVSIVDVSDREPWRRAFGHAAIWGWEFKNQQGYVDGARFEFPDTTIELVVAASAIQLWVSRRVPLDPA